MSNHDARASPGQFSDQAAPSAARPTLGFTRPQRDASVRLAAMAGPAIVIQMSAGLAT